MEQQHAPVAGPSRYFTPSYPRGGGGLINGANASDSGTTATANSLHRSPPGMMVASTSDLRLQDEAVYVFDYVQQPGVAASMAAAGNGRPRSPSLPPQDHQIGATSTNGHAARSAFQVGGGRPLPDLVYSGGGGGGSNGFDQRQQQHEPFATTSAAATNVYDFGPPSDSTTSTWLNPADFIASSSSSASNGNRKGKGPIPPSPPPAPELQREGAAAGTRGACKRQRSTRAAQQHQDHVLDYGGGGVGGGRGSDEDDDPEADNGSEYLGEDGDAVAYDYSGQRRPRYGGQEDGRLGAGDDPGDEDDFSAASGLGGGEAAILEDAAAQDETEPLYVNAKQYHRILKRRIARARLEEMGRLSRERKVRFLFYWHTAFFCPLNADLHTQYSFA